MIQSSSVLGKRGKLVTIFFSPDEERICTCYMINVLKTADNYFLYPSSVDFLSSP